ncbi:MAG: hypothetical protein HYX78_06060 [Armatimonadetes bacterium]|nr:hypothetical protein [Armatimonadota bacterium]
MRTQKAPVATKHLSNSRAVFLRLLEISRSIDDSKMSDAIGERDYEDLDLYVMTSLLGG